MKSGALLAQLDSRAAALTQTEAQANAKSITQQLAAVRADCARYESLLARGAIAQQEYERQASQCRTQEASEEAARARAAEAARVVQDTGIRAPFAGVIGERYASVGDFMQPSSRVVTLLVDNPLRLRLTVPEAAIGYAREGVAVTFQVVGVPNRAFTATIKYIGREIRPLTRDVIDEAVVDNSERLLLPGMFATVDLPTGTAPQPIVPKASIVQTDSGPTVLVVVDGRLQQRAVHIGAAVEESVAVSEGIGKGERVVVRPPPDAVDGALVE